MCFSPVAAATAIAPQQQQEVIREGGEGRLFEWDTIKILHAHLFREKSQQRGQVPHRTKEKHLDVLRVVRSRDTDNDKVRMNGMPRKQQDMSGGKRHANTLRSRYD